MRVVPSALAITRRYRASSGPKGLPRAGRALRDQLIVVVLVIARPLAALQEDDAQARLRQFLGDDAAARAGSDDDRIDMGKCHGVSWMKRLGTAAVTVLPDDIGVGQAKHAVAGVILVAAVARTAVEALHGVIANQAEELAAGDALPMLLGRLPRLQLLQQLDLLFGGKLLEGLPVKGLARGRQRCESSPIPLGKPLVRPTNCLSMKVTHPASLAPGSWSVGMISRTHCIQQRRLGIGQEPPPRRLTAEQHPIQHRRRTTPTATPAAATAATFSTFRRLVFFAGPHTRMRQAVAYSSLESSRTLEIFARLSS